MRRPSSIVLALLLAGPALAQQPGGAAPAGNAAAKPVAPAAKPAVQARDAKATPNAERVARIAALDKRTGLSRVFEGNPGSVFSFGTLTIALKACEVTPPWEQKLTGAFLQVDDAEQRNGQRGARKRVFSGWMFAESPSLNPLEHPRYDVWVRSCAMKWPDSGPGTVVVGSASRPAATQSSAPQSAETGSAAASSDR